MKYKTNCLWCDESYFKSRKHVCPKIFIHDLEKDGDAITIRGNNLQIKWLKDKILIWSEK